MSPCSRPATSGCEPLSFDTGGKAGDEAAILGYPQNGPFDARAARIRGELTLRSPDIYDRGEHMRKTYSVRGLVRSGNSGGPLVSRDGGVLGVIFAASVTDSSTGYALTASQVAGAADRGSSATSGRHRSMCMIRTPENRRQSCVHCGSPIMARAFPGPG